jgi:RecB family exonuclease
MSDHIKLSVSKTKCFKQCKKQYHYAYVLKFPKKERNYHVTGSFCHKVLEEFHQAYIDGCVLPYNVTMTQAWKTAWAEFGAKMTPDMKRECWDLINGYLRKVSREKLGNILAVEQKFEFNITETVSIRGGIDKVTLDDDNVLRVSDYKTTKKGKKYLQDDMFQLMTYGYVLLQEHPEIDKIRGSYILLRHDFEEITREFSREQLLGIKQQFLDYAQSINEETEFPANPTVLCGWCDHVDICEEGRAKVASNPATSKSIFGEVGY